MTTPAERDALLARARKMQSVGASLLSNGSLLIKGLEALDVEEPPPPPAPTPRTRYGANLVETADWTGGVKETAKTSRDRYLATYGALPAARAFYPGTLPARLNTAKEGLAPLSYVSFKHDPAAVAAGALDAALGTYLDSIPAGQQVRLILWHEPDDEMWVRGDFTAATYRAATDHVCDIVHAHPASKDGRAEVWACFMAFSVPCQPGNPNRFDKAAVSPKLDGIGWDLYWNKTDRWPTEAEVRKALTYLRDLNAALGVPRLSILETGDNPHTNDPDGSGRVAFWDMHCRLAAEHHVEDFLYFDVVGTTGDHRRVPGRWDCPPALVEVFSRYMKG